MWSSWVFGREGSTRCLEDPRDSTIQPSFVFGTLWDAFGSATSFLVLEWTSFLHGMAASMGLSNVPRIFWGGQVFFVIQINKVDSSQSSSIVEFWLLVFPLLFFAILSGFPNFAPYLRPCMIWSRSRLNFCQSPRGPTKIPWEVLLLIGWILWTLSKNLTNCFTNLKYWERWEWKKPTHHNPAWC